MAKRKSLNIDNVFDKEEKNAVYSSAAERQRVTKAGPSKKVDELELLLGKDGLDDELDEKMITNLVKRAAKETTAIDGKITIRNQIANEREILCCKYSEEFDFVAGGYTDGFIRIYDVPSGNLTFTLVDNEVDNNRAPVTSIQHRPVSKSYPVTNCFTATYANGCVKCWSYNFNQCLYTIREKRQTFGICYHPRFPKFITYGDDGHICFYDEESKTQERIFTPSEDPEKHDGHMSRVFAGRFHTRNNYELITGGWDDVVQFWDVRVPYAIRHLSGIHMCGEGLDINQRGTEIMTCAFQAKNSLQLWDYGSGKLIMSIEPDIFPCKLYCGRYVGREFILTGGTEPNLLRIIDQQTTTTIASLINLPGAVYGLDVGPQRKVKERDRDREGKESYRTKSDVANIPKSIFISGKKIYLIEPSVM